MIARLHARSGVSRKDLAEMFQISPRQVDLDIAWAREHFRRTVGEHKLEDLRVELLMELDMVKDEAKRGWRRSLRPLRRVGVRTRQPGERVETRMFELRAGNPDFLAMIREVIGDIRDLLGLDAPRQVAPVTGGKPLPAFRIIDFGHADGHPVEAVNPGGGGQAGR